MRPRLAHAWAYLAYAAVALGIVPLAQPVLLPDVLAGHDAAAHQTYAFLFERALAQGQVPVRWVEGIADGMGQPLFNHYQAGFYYLVTLLHWSGPELSLALKLVVAITWAGGAGFMFLLCRPLGSLPAALASAVFAWSPYLLVDAYVRSAYPELAAIALAPGVLWSVDGLLRTGRRIFLGSLALILALLLVTHLPTSLIVAPVAIGFAAVSWIVHGRPTARLRLVLAGGLLGAGLSAFYVAPAIVQLDAIQIGRITAGGFDYHRHFVEPAWWFDRSWGYAGSGQGAGDRLSLQLGIVQWAILAAAAGLLALPRLRARVPVSAVAIAGWLSAVAVALFLMTAPSAFVWDAIGPMKFVQFPWRLLMVPAIACAVLAAILLSGVRDRRVQAAIVLCVVALQWHQTAPYRESASTRARAVMPIDDAAWPATDNARTSAFREPAYDPISVAGTREPARGRWTITGEAEVTPVSVTDARLELAIAAPQPVALAIHSPFYPGWRITVDRRPVTPSVDAASGYMTIQLPAGVHRVDAGFERDGVRAAADLITLVSAAIWLALAIVPLLAPLARRVSARRPRAAIRPRHAGSTRAPATPTAHAPRLWRGSRP